MQEIIDSIIAAEREAKNRLAEVAKSADAVKARADADAAAMIARASEEAAAELKRHADAARLRAEKACLESRKALERRAEALYASMEPLVPGLAKKAARLASTTELEPQ